MPRPWVIKVEDYATYSDNRWYRVEVMQVDKSREPAGIRIALKHLDPDQLGREVTLIIPLPLRPGCNLGASFFAACDMATAIEVEIVPKATIGRTMLARFDPATNQPIEFKEHTDERKPESSHATKRPPDSAATKTPEADGDGGPNRGDRLRRTGNMLASKEPAGSIPSKSRAPSRLSTC